MLLLLCLVTSVYGIVIIASATNYMGSGGYVLRQLLALLLGIVCYIAFTLLDVDIFAERWHLLFLFNVLFLLLLVPFGIEGTTGNRSWISFPFLPFNIQPAELCKIPFIIILAKTMQTNQRKLSAPRSILQLGFQVAFIVLLILVLSKDAGVALVYVFIFLVMAFVGGVKLRWFLAGFAAAGAAAPLAWKYLMRDDQKNRIAMVFDPTIDPEGTSVRWHTKQSMLSLNNGGLTGQGLFHGARTPSREPGRLEPYGLHLFRHRRGAGDAGGVVYPAAADGNHRPLRLCGAEDEKLYEPPDLHRHRGDAGLPGGDQCRHVRRLLPGHRSDAALYQLRWHAPWSRCTWPWASSPGSTCGLSQIQRTAISPHATNDLSAYISARLRFSGAFCCIMGMQTITQKARSET